MKKRSRRGSEVRRPPTRTGTEARSTRVRDPRAAMRFSLDDQVSWDESFRADGSQLVFGTIDAFLEDECMVRLRLDDGSIMLAPTMSARLKHAQMLLPDAQFKEVVSESWPDEDDTDPDCLVIVASYEGEEGDE